MSLDAITCPYCGEHAGKECDHLLCLQEAASEGVARCVTSFGWDIKSSLAAAMTHASGIFVKEFRFAEDLDLRHAEEWLDFPRYSELLDAGIVADVIAHNDPVWDIDEWLLVLKSFSGQYHRLSSSGTVVWFTESRKKIADAVVGRDPDGVRVVAIEALFKTWGGSYCPYCSHPISFRSPVKCEHLWWSELDEDSHASYHLRVVDAIREYYEVLPVELQVSLELKRFEQSKDVHHSVSVIVKELGCGDIEDLWTCDTWRYEANHPLSPWYHRDYYVSSSEAQRLIEVADDLAARKIWEMAGVLDEWV